MRTGTARWIRRIGRGAILAFACALLLPLAAQTPEQQIAADAATALGGRERVLAAKTMLLEGAGNFVGITSLGMTTTSASSRRSNSSATGDVPTI